MNIQTLLKQATREDGNIDLNHYTNLVLQEACRLIKQTPITGAYTSFDEQVAITQRTDCFRQVYNQIVENIKNVNNT
jgi:hypothetical protein